MTRIYWLDANVFIQAQKGPYAFNLVPKFWTFLSGQLAKGIIRTPKMVYDELVEGQDDLTAWCKQRRQKGLCHHPDQAVQTCYGTIASHVATEFKPHQAAEFLMGADGWLVAHAMNGDGIVVTQETERSHRAKIKIPTICKIFSVKWMNTYEMLRDLGASF
jgi:hypothetical protein